MVGGWNWQVWRRLKAVREPSVLFGRAGVCEGAGVVKWRLEACSGCRESLVGGAPWRQTVGERGLTTGGGCSDRVRGILLRGSSNR